MVNVFQLNKKYGEWAEGTFFKYLKDNKNKIGFNIFYYGSQVSTRKKDVSDATLRPDFIIIKTENVVKLEKKYGFNMDNPSIEKLKELFDLSKEDKKSIEENKEIWLTKIRDLTNFMKDLVRLAHCRVEIKSGFGFFVEKKYKKGKYNIIVDSRFKDRIDKLNDRFKRKLKTYVIYIQLNKVFIAELDKIFGEDGKEIERLYERRGTSDINRVKTQNLNFLKSYEFADVEGIVKEIKKEEYKINAKPYVEIIGGSVKFNLDMDLGKLTNVQINIIKELKD